MSLGDAGLSFRIVFSGQEHANPAHPLSLLRVRSSRPCDRNAAKPSHEMTPPHSTLASSLTGSGYQMRSQKALQQCCAAIGAPSPGPQDRGTARATLGNCLAVSAFPLSVPV
jgi:hypothetical protein